MFRSLPQLRAWLNMPAPRMFFERECNPAPLPDAQKQTQDEPDDQESSEEYYAVKGGDNDGIFSTMAQAVEARNRSGGEFAVFASKNEAELFLRSDKSFVVWVARDRIYEQETVYQGDAEDGGG